MNTKWLIMLLAAAALGLGGCSDSDGGSPLDTGQDQQDDDNNNGDTSDAPEQYEFESQLVEGESAVSYTGQTKRHILIADLVSEILSWDRDPGHQVSDLEFYYRFNADTSDSIDYRFELPEHPGMIVPGPTYGDIADGKDLVGKTAGEDPPELLGGEFFGWTSDGISGDPTPVELVDKFFELLVAEAQNDTSPPQVPVSGGSTPEVTEPYIDEYGRDYRQLIQKFLLGAVAFSQGTNDYLQTDFQATNEPEEEGSPYTVGGHNWDEAFGYFGAARNYNDYTDDEIRGSGPDRRAEFENGYNDANGDGNIDIRSEYNFGNSVNCAKRDAGSADNTNPTDFTQTAFDAFLAGRHILVEAADGELTDAQAEELRGHVVTAAKTWEKCVAATVVHYINDVLAEMERFDTANDAFEDLDNFKTLAKTWGEMKGFALGLQFSPESPFRDGSVDGIDIDDLKQALSLMGDAPVLADGTQHGETANVDDYRSDLLAVRDTFQQAYEFDAENVENW